MAAPLGNKFAVGHKPGNGGGRPRNVDYAPFIKILEGKIAKKDIERITEKVKYKEIEYFPVKDKKGKPTGKMKPVTVEKEKIETTFATIWDALAWYIINGDKEMIKMVYNKFYPDVRQVEANVNEILDKEDMKQYTNEELDTIIAEGKSIKKSRADKTVQNGEGTTREVS